MEMASTKTLLSDLVSTVSSVPPNYIRPVSDRPNLDEDFTDDSIPLIDLQGLLGPNRSDVVNQIGLACQNYGFFQVLYILHTDASLGKDQGNGGHQ